MDPKSEQQLVVFELDKEEYAVPILDVKEIVKNVEITPVPDSPDFILGVINLRGKIAPILDMEKRFGLVRDNQGNSLHVIMHEDNNGTLAGILVDKVIGVIRVATDLIKPTPTMVSSKVSGDCLKGVVVLEEDRIILILDLNKVFNLEDINKSLNITE